MAPGRAIEIGIDALVTCLTRFIYTSALIGETYTNVVPTMRFANLKILRMEKKIVSQHLQECVHFLSPSFPDIEFHSVQRYCKVTKKFPREHFFGFEEKLGVIEKA